MSALFYAWDTYPGMNRTWLEFHIKHDSRVCFGGQPISFLQVKNSPFGTRAICKWCVHSNPPWGYLALYSNCWSYTQTVRVYYTYSLLLGLSSKIKSTRATSFSLSSDSPCLLAHLINMSTSGLGDSAVRHIPPLLRLEQPGKPLATQMRYFSANLSPVSVSVLNRCVLRFTNYSFYNYLRGRGLPFPAQRFESLDYTIRTGHCSPIFFNNNH
jgi:hypothetical protein